MSSDNSLDSDGKFWLGIWSVIGIFLSVLIISLVLYYHNTNKMILTSIQSGADPVRVRYAFSQSTISQDVLTILKDRIDEKCDCKPDSK